MGCAALLNLATSGNLGAQVTTPPVPASAATPADSNDAANPAALPINPQDQSTLDQSRAQVPSVSQSPVNPQPTNIPGFQLQPGNPISPYNSSSANPQSPQLTAPTLYVTGANDLSQVSTGNALSQAFGQQGASGFYSEPLTDYDNAPIDRIRLGPFDLRAAVVTNVIADDNLRTGDGPSGGSGGGSKGDVSFGVTPAVMLQYGNHDGQVGYAALVYSPTFTRYVHHSDENTDNYQNVAFNALYPFQRLTLNLTQTYTQTTGVNTDSNVRTTQAASLSMIGATYEVDDRISVSSQLQEVISKYSGANGQGAGGGNGETITSLNSTATYRLSEKMTIGPSVNFGIDKTDGSSQQTYEQGFLGLNYAPTEKIGLYAQGGAEVRQYEEGAAKVNPVFSAGVGYTPFESTTLEVSATQSVHSNTDETNNSGTATNSETVLSTGVDASISQRIAQRFYLGFDFAYNHNDNQGVPGGAAGLSGTSQDTMTYRPSLTFNPTSWTSVALYYQYESNESNVPGSTYNDNQVSLTVSAQF